MTRRTFPIHFFLHILEQEMTHLSFNDAVAKTLPECYKLCPTGFFEYAFADTVALLVAKST